MKKKLPQTSHDAHKAVTQEMKSDHWDKIMLALQFIGEGNYEEIARKSKLDRHAVGRRLSELVAEQFVFNTGKTSPTSKGRGAIVYRLTELGLSQVPQASQKKHMTDKEVEQTWQDIQNEPLPEPNKHLVQANLF